MKLSEHLSMTGQTYKQFGSLAGCSASEICRFANGTRTPTLEKAVAIERATGGLVTPADFVEEKECV